MQLNSEAGSQVPRCPAAQQSCLCMLELRGARQERSALWGRGHSPNTHHQVIPYTPISLLSPLVRSCPRAMGAQAPPTAAAAGQVTFLPWSHSCRAGELCTHDFQLSRALQRGSSECFVGSALCPPSCCKPFPSPQQARPRAPAKGCPSPANRELGRFPGLVPSLPSRGEKVRAGSRTEASPHTALGGQIHRGQSSCRQMCRWFSGTVQAPAPELCPTLLWAPGLGSWGA